MTDTGGRPAQLRLTGKQARHLRGLGHHLRPAAFVGRDGLTPAVVAAVDAVLAETELVKVRVGQGCPADRRAVAEALSAATGAAVAQVLGRTVLLYRPGEEPRIALPAAGG